MKETGRAEYQAVRETVGFLDLSDRGKIKVTGPDRVSFLHSMISNDVQELSEWHGRYGTFLTARGKIVADFFYYKLPQFVLVDIHRDLLDRTIQTLGKYIVMDEVYLEDVSDEFEHFSLQGPGSPDLIREVFGISGPSVPYAMEQTNWNDSTVWLVRKNELADSGFELIVPDTMASSMRDTVFDKGTSFGLSPVGPATQNVLRLEAGIPWYGVDMDENRYPMEARLDEAISLTKGCYIGQEVVAKATHIGGVSNLLMGLKFKEDHVPAPHSRVLDSGGKQIGTVTSAVFSPRFNCPIGFAYLKRSFARPGEVCQVQTGEGKTQPAEVVDRFQ